MQTQQEKWKIIEIIKNVNYLTVNTYKVRKSKLYVPTYHIWSRLFLQSFTGLYARLYETFNETKGQEGSVEKKT